MPFLTSRVSLTHILQVFWACTFVLTVMDWRNGKGRAPRDPPFTHPTDADDHVSQEDEESLYHHAQPTPSRTTSTYDDDITSPFADSNRYSSVPSVNAPSYTTTAPAAPQPRPSIDAYGAFSDPAPSGFGSVPQLPEPSFGRPLSPPDENPRLSRTMQYADPYAAVRATVAASGPTQNPGYSGYR